MQNGAPVMVLNTNTKRKYGHKVQIENIAAGKYVFDSFLKLLQSVISDIM